MHTMRRSVMRSDQQQIHRSHKVMNGITLQH
jgi:hypothetical protein